jgi:hypothetical protein
MNDSLVQIGIHNGKKQLYLKILSIRSYHDNARFIYLFAIMEDDVFLLHILQI